ncbi:MAG TPA: hypothetical protein VHW71_01865 [Steroidobacteraceae bacterium]|jgi:hypothetical protein|nr:hypothetical protein [Steroidobacteraceae bacterium]
MDPLTTLQIHNTLERLRAIEEAVTVDTNTAYGGIASPDEIRRRTDNAVRIFCTIYAQ